MTDALLEPLEKVKVKKDYFLKRYTEEERKELTAQYGCVPAGLSFSPSLTAVRKWGFPLWQVYEAVYERNAKLGSLTEDDNLWVWKCLHVLLAKTVSRMSAPITIFGTTARKQWLEDFFSTASSWLWTIMTYGRNKLLSPTNAIQFTIHKTRSYVFGGSINRIYDLYLSDMVTEMSVSRGHWGASTFDEVADRMDRVSRENKLDAMVVEALIARFPDSMFPGIAAAADAVVLGVNGMVKHKWLIDFAVSYRRIFRDALRQQERES